MPVFQARTRVQIIRDMVARVVARSTLAGLVRNAAVFHTIAATADELAEVYIQIALMRDLFSIDRATGSDLDERAREIQPGIVSRISALYANGNVRFSRPGTAGILAIPQGTIVGFQDASGLVRFRTTAPGQINNLASVSADIPVTCLEAGTRGNASAGVVVKMISRIAGVTGVTNPTAFTNGRDRESDEDFRRRLKAFIRSLARGTVTSLETAAKNARMSDGARVIFARVYEDGFEPWKVYLYIDDATGAIDTYDSTYVGTWDTILTALGGERRAFTTEKPIRDDGSWELQRNGVTLVRNTDYTLNAATGQVTFSSTVFPSGLTAADVIRVHYRFYTRLVQEAQKIIDGDRTNRTQYPGVRAGGAHVFVLPAIALPQTLVGGISVAEGYDPIVVGTLAKQAVQEYINGLDIGDDVIVSEIIQRVMDVEGVYDFNLTSLSATSPPTNQVIQDYQVARIAAGDITLV